MHKYILIGALLLFGAMSCSKNNSTVYIYITNLSEERQNKDVQKQMFNIAHLFVLENLMSENDDSLISSWDRTKKTLTFQLKDQIFFHNGKKLTSHLLKEKIIKELPNISIEEREENSLYLPNISDEEIEKLLQIHIIFNNTLVDHQPIIGTGPYYFFQQNKNSIILKRFSEYRTNKNIPQKIIITYDKNSLPDNYFSINLEDCDNYIPTKILKQKIIGFVHE